MWWTMRRRRGMEASSRSTFGEGCGAATESQLRSMSRCRELEVRSEPAARASESVRPVKLMPNTWGVKPRATTHSEGREACRLFGGCLRFTCEWLSDLRVWKLSVDCREGLARRYSLVWQGRGRQQ